MQWRRWGRRRGLAAAAAIAGLAVLALPGCGGDEPAAPAVNSVVSPAVDSPVYSGDVGGGYFAGGYDEVIGADGVKAAGFADGDYVQLRRPDDIAPIYAPEFVAADAAGRPDEEPVIGLALNGEARAYPTGILYRRELVNDVVGGVPALVSWCPLCYTALVHERRVDGAAAVFGNQGALYRGAMTWYDHATGSVWSQPLGAAIAGPEAGRRLALLPAQVTTWGEWRAAYPHTLLLSDGGIPAPPYRGRRPGDGHIVGVVVGDGAASWSYRAVAESADGGVVGRVGNIAVALRRDEASGAIRAWSGGVELPVIIAYRRAWEEFYGGD